MVNGRFEVNNHSTQENMPLLPPLVSILSEKVERNTEGRGAGVGDVESFVRRNRISGWVMLWRRMGCISAFVRRSRSDGWKVSDRLYHGTRTWDGR